MPDVLKAVLEKYPDLKPVKIFPFDTRDDDCVRYAFYGKGKVEDGIMDHVKEAYEALAKKGDILVWKLPKTFVNFAKRLGYVARDGLPDEDESFYNLLYVFVAEIDAEAVAETLKVDFTGKEDAVLAMQAGDLGYLFKRKE